eukprot:1194873-Prorocentrum_minimum.AAC.3
MLAGTPCFAKRSPSLPVITLNATEDCGDPGGDLHPGSHADYAPASRRTTVGTVYSVAEPHICRSFVCYDLDILSVHQSNVSRDPMRVRGSMRPSWWKIFVSGRYMMAIWSGTFRNTNNYKYNS